MVRVAAFAGPSNSGKTTKVCEVIRHFADRGMPIAAIKHTHHALTDERRGDTERFLAAGASRAILAGDGEAVIFENHVEAGDLARRSGGVARHHRISFVNPPDLLVHLECERVVVEGFKSFHGWPRAESVEEAISLLS